LAIWPSNVSFDAKEAELDQKLGVRISWWLVLTAACTHFCLAYFQNCQPFLNLSQYIRGHSRLPYQNRVLMAWVLREGLRLPHLASLGAHLPVALSDPRVSILFIASWISLFGSVLLTWRSLNYLTGDEQYSRWASLVVVYMAYFQFPLVFGLNFLLPYDLPSLLFFCGCVYCVITRRMAYFYLFFIAGAFNRETICMTTLFLVIWRWQERSRRRVSVVLIAHVLGQAAIWILIRRYLHHLFADNLPDTVGASFYYKLSYNLHSIAEPQQWPVLTSLFGFTLPLVLTWRRWMKNAAMERGIYLLAAWFTVMMLVGVLIEIRVFSELISYMALAVGLIFYHRFPALQTANTDHSSRTD
jgi:hypothetical protein